MNFPLTYRSVTRRQMQFVCAVALMVVCLMPWRAVAQTKANTDVVTIFAASSLAPALADISALYHQRTGNHLRLSTAASSTLARQIASAAPVDIFISANARWMDWLTDGGHVMAQSQHPLLRNRLVLAAAKTNDTPLLADISKLGELDGLIAIGDPDHVPAGIYARQALAHLNQWDALQPRLVRTVDARATVALVARGEVAAGIMYETDVRLNDAIKMISAFPPSSHDAIVYHIGLVGTTPSPQAVHALAFIASSDSQQIFTQHGFGIAPPVATNGN